MLNKIIYAEFINQLQQNDKKLLELLPYIEFMQTLNNFIDKDGNAFQKIHAKNSIKWLQKFVNGYLQETALKALNNKLFYIEENHEGLISGSVGNNVPDFKFTYEGIEYTLDAKIYSNKDSFKDILYGKSFHGAKFVLAFCLDDGKYYWRVRINDDVHNYSTIIAHDELSEPLQKILGWIQLPKEQTMLRINVPSDACDDQLPEAATYSFRQVLAN